MLIKKVKFIKLIGNKVCDIFLLICKNVLVSAIFEEIISLGK